MKKAIIIIPYFGKFPQYFQLFLNSCEMNKGFQWLFITDNNDDYNYPANVKVIHSTFDQIRNRITLKFRFNISLENVHKLCEFKPAYGWLFPEYIAGYQYWGYGDIDLIYGNLDKFINEKLYETYDKLFDLGHFSLIKNTIENNELFMRPYKGKKIYKMAFSKPENFNFDESFGHNININRLFCAAGKKVYVDRRNIADIYTKSNQFRIIREDEIEKVKEAFFYWNKHGLYRAEKRRGNILTEEYMYIHLQKRKMAVMANHNELYKIIPNCFENLECNEKDISREFSKIKKKRYNNQYLKIRYNNLRAKIKDGVF
ncbi:DUF6625 family protein [Lachnospiraceae bacterium 48-21]